MLLVYLLVFVTTFVNPLSAQDFEPMPRVVDSSFEKPTEALGKAEPISMPNCTDQAFEERVKSEIATFLKTTNATSGMAKRRNALISANITGFEEIDASNFAPETDYNTANALITLKINGKLGADNIRLCRQKGKGNLYIVMYPYRDNIKAHIINLNRYDIKNEGVSFIYP